MEVVLDNAGGVVVAGEVAGQYRGVGKRKWGKWVSEIREPGKKTRIWLGSFESPEMAAVAHDVAALRLRGREARLNFPGLIHHFRRPATAKPEDVRAAALEAAAQVRLRPDLVMQPGGCPDPRLGDVARDVLLGADELAVVAHDVAAVRLRGREARLNFPGLIHHFPRPATAEPEDVRAAALEAAPQVQLRPDLVMQPGGCPDPWLGNVARDVLLGADEVAAESPNMWAELAEAMLIAPPVCEGYAADNDEWTQGTLWDLSIWNY